MPPVRRLLLFVRHGLRALLTLAVGTAVAVPYTPRDDAQVLATVPARANDPRAREMLALREVWRRDPQDLGASLRLAQRWFDEVAAEGDPRYIGYAQAALRPWWGLADAPPAVRVLRAKLLQFDHRFADALADLDGALAIEPDNADAWAWRTAIHMVMANYEQARRGCAHLAGALARACAAQVDAATGQAGRAAAALRQALAEEAAPEARLWMLTRLAETEERRGRFAEAEAAFREALALGLPDVYLRAAYADFLLDRGRAGDVVALLKGLGRADVLLLRQALAAQALKAPDAKPLADELGARFEAARQHGDTTHRKEESRYLRALRGDFARALVLAKENYAQQREPADARLLLEAALAAGDAAAAQPGLDWMASSRIESEVLHRLAQQLKALK